MSDSALLLAQAVLTALPAAWLTTGLRDNILHADMNRAIVAEVMAMSRLQAAFPTDFAQVSGRAVTDPALHRLVFRLIVLAELAALLLLWAGAGALLLAALGMAAPTWLALAGTVAFTAIWAGFLTAGNHFCYWYCHDGAQTTHFHLTLWGMATAIFLAL